jgi:hypothetical protein
MGWQPTGSTGGGGGAVSSVAAANASVTVTPTTGAVTVSQTDANLATLLDAFTSTSGVSLVDNNSSGIVIEELAANAPVSISAQGGGGSISLAATGTISLSPSGTGGLTITAPSNGFELFTADKLADLPVPATAPAFGFTQDGNLYFYPVGGPWEQTGTNPAAGAGNAYYNSITFQ